MPECREDGGMDSAPVVRIHRMGGGWNWVEGEEDWASEGGRGGSSLCHWTLIPLASEAAHHGSPWLDI